MKKLLQLSKALMLIALGAGGAEFIQMYRSGEINKIYEQEALSKPVIKAASFIADPVSVDETKTNILQKEEAEHESTDKEDVIFNLFTNNISSLSIESYSRAAPGRRYEEVIIPDSLLVNPAVVITDSSDVKIILPSDSALARHD